MKIEQYILETYPSAGPFSATSSLETLIMEKGYVVIIDETNTFYGLLTICDLIKKPHKLAIDCLSEKENIFCHESVTTCLDKFKNNQCTALPVFNKDKFIGVIEKQNIIDDLKNQINQLYEESIISQKVKQSFLQNLSHEIRTPLSGMLGFLDLVSDLRLEEQREAYGIIQKNADKFLLILDDLVNLARIDSGDKIRLKIEKINIEDVFVELKDYFQILILESNLKVSASYATNTDNHPIAISTDRKIIKHILYHLIDNAIKFSPDNGKIHFGYKKQDKNIVLFVKNNGNQIPKEKKEQIFDIFEKHSYSNDKLIDGLGIGLPLVKRYSELLNGEIEYSSDETQTIFNCIIPIEIEQPVYN